MKKKTRTQTRPKPSTHVQTIGRLIIFMISAAALMPHTVSSQTGAYTLNGGSAAQSSQTYSATAADQSAVYVLNSGTLTLTGCTMAKTGDASSVNNASQYGINAGVLAASSGKVTITGGSVTTNASGGNGLFATGSGSSVTMQNGIISASGGNAHGVDATYGGSVTLTSVDVTTNGASSSAIATDFGGGTVTVTGGIIVAASTQSNSHSAAIYSTGTISVTDATASSSADCGGVIDGANSILLKNTSLTGKVEGIKIWKTAPASGAATVVVDGGLLTSTSGDAFYVTGETGNSATAVLTVKNGAVVTGGSGNILNAVAPGTATLTADAVALSGNLVTTGSSTISATLKNGTSLTGRIASATLTIDSTSSWTLTGNSTLTTLTDPGKISGSTITNITGNGYSVHYDSTLSSNQWLGGHTYSLVNGGVLTAGSLTSVLENNGVLPAAPTLGQNYPNPFNPSTTISFRIPERMAVTLTVYDMLGRQIAVLKNGTEDAGSYTVTFNAANLASGMYIYRLRAGGTVQTGKMILQK
jgi:hypothetical protein